MNPTTEDTGGQSSAAERPGVMLFAEDGHLRTLASIEADILRLAVSSYGGCVSEVARRLRIGRSTVYRKLEEIGHDI